MENGVSVSVSAFASSISVLNTFFLKSVLPIFNETALMSQKVIDIIALLIEGSLMRCFATLSSLSYERLL